VAVAELICNGSAPFGTALTCGAGTVEAATSTTVATSMLIGAELAGAAADASTTAVASLAGTRALDSVSADTDLPTGAIAAADAAADVADAAADVADATASLCAAAPAKRSLPSTEVVRAAVDIAG
jgi:hypothetical protein